MPSLSFVVVQYSDELNHNFLLSPCVRDPANQVVLIKNIGNLCFQSLGEAYNHGICQAVHHHVVLIHEDVFLAEDWQGQFNHSLDRLNRIDPHWAVLGCAGMTHQGEVVGHWRDPRGLSNIFKDDQSFVKIRSLDEHLLILRQTSPFRFDSAIPGIHGLGTDLLLSAEAANCASYVINARSWHKYKNAHGEVISSPDMSPKIKHRTSLTYLAGKQCCDEYISRKWSHLLPLSSISTRYQPFVCPSIRFHASSADLKQRALSPIVLLGKGGGASRLLSAMAQDCGVFLGQNVSVSGDSMEMVPAVYQSLIEHYKCTDPWQKTLFLSRLRGAAANMLRHSSADAQLSWGFKLPESLLLLQQIALAFPNARFAVLTRSPLSTCLRRTHMTARLDNEIGQLTLAAAYDANHMSREAILSDSSLLHSAYTTEHQWSSFFSFLESRGDASLFFRCRYEDLFIQPQTVLDSFSRWLQRPVIGHSLLSQLDTGRAFKTLASVDQSELERVRHILGTITKKLGYSLDELDASRPLLCRQKSRRSVEEAFIPQL